jgi:hypothetical protein
MGGRKAKFVRPLTGSTEPVHLDLFRNKKRLKIFAASNNWTPFLPAQASLLSFFKTLPFLATNTA